MDFVLSIQIKSEHILKRHCGAYYFGDARQTLGWFKDGNVGVILYFMIVGKVPFDSVFIQELRRQVVTGVYLVHCVVIEEVEDLLSL